MTLPAMTRVMWWRAGFVAQAQGIGGITDRRHFRAKLSTPSVASSSAAFQPNISSSPSGVISAAGYFCGGQSAPAV